MRAKTLVMMAAMVMAAGMVTAASVAPVLVDPWQSGDAAFEAEQAGNGTSCGDFAWKVDAGAPNGTYDTGTDQYGNSPIENGPTITISNSDGQTFDWEISAGYTVCAVIVKASTVALVYNYYPEASSDTGLYSPTNPNNGNLFDISHVTFVFNEADGGQCYQEETAWAAGNRYVRRGNWATYTPYPGAGESVDIFAGQTTFAGTATFSGPNGGYVNIDIELASGCIFYYDVFDQYGDNNIKIQDYATAPSGNPAPGLFATKAMAEVGSTSYSIGVPANNFYGIHLDVACPVPCE